MSLGKRKGSDFLPILKYDATHGNFYLQDRVNRGGIWESEQTDVTSSLVAIFDMECIQVGWITSPRVPHPK